MSRLQATAQALRKGRIFGVFAVIATCSALGVCVTGTARAGEVQLLTGPTRNAPHGTAYVKLADGERVTAGGSLRATNGSREHVLRVLEAYGDRVVVQLPAHARVKVGQALKVKAPTGDGRPPTPPKTWDRSGRDWTERAPLSQPIGLDDAGWLAVTQRPRELVSWRGEASGSGGEQRAKGDVRLAAVMVKRTGANDDPWLQLRLGSRLKVPRLFGMPLRYSHDVALYVDTIGDDQGGQRARQLLQLRQLEVATARARQRGWQLRGGRIAVADGAGTQLVDGAAAALQIGERLSLRAFGGLGPDIVSGALAVDVQRFGAQAGYQQRGADTELEAAAGYSGSLYGGALDRQLVGGRVYVRNPLGTLRADVDMALGGAELTGTGAAQLPQHDAARLHRAWLGITTSPDRPWIGRLRYSYYAQQAWRELAMAVAQDQLVLWQRHSAVLSADWRRTDGAWLSPSLFGGFASGEDRFDGGRLGGAISGGWAGPAWSMHGGASYQTGFEQTVTIDEFDTTQRNGHVDLLTAFVGGRLRATEALGVGLRLSATQTRVHPVDASATRARARLHGDWLAPPWTVTASVGMDRALAMQSYYPQDRVDWLDATLLIRRSLP